MMPSIGFKKIPLVHSNEVPYVEKRDSPGALTAILVTLYVLSGSSQPLMMTVLRYTGLADPTCQLYMMFYYMGTASAIFMPLKSEWPSKVTILKACGIALFDIVAQAMNYTGASLAGPTIFAIIYSSVTIWAAVYSQLFLGRKMVVWQWLGVMVVFGGLALTATDSLELGPGVSHGLILVTLGSSMHGMFYVMSEAVMTVGSENLSVQQNCAIQGLTAFSTLFLWQLVYTVPRFDEKLWEPMQRAGTRLTLGLGVLVVFALISFVHSMTFYYTLRHLPGGSTSAGVFKALQAVLVFVFTDWIYCGRLGGDEMCFSEAKLLSLITVSGGVIWYGSATRNHGRSGTREGYEEVDDSDNGEIESLGSPC